ncbi:cytoplasmic linker protein [Babesia caballi]|uniref:Cytoplasmic linker protein n=1 Tax=Babesia caballi TaxID=5871 RepID=A0AAV4LQ23_BABCB|nr:cytoplasmic linker protein [Babesia caballi]
MFCRLPLHRGGWRSRRFFSAERARLSERLWDTLVPERNWTPFTPQFWVLFVATVSLYCYNRSRPEKVDDVISDEERKRAEALSRLARSSDT